MTVIYTVILLFNIFIYVNSQNVCSFGEVYDTCGTSCPKTCSDPNPEICSNNCVQGCFCPPEKVRNEDDQCVFLKDCVTKNSRKEICPAGEEFHDCGTSCPPTCSIPNPKICNLLCVRGCFCPQGQVRDSNTGTCVHPANCTCPKSEEYFQCRTLCPITCEHQNPVACTYKCVPGCSCAKGKIRQERTGKCVVPEDCSKCPEGEVYVKCGGNCQPTCYHPHPWVCPNDCVPACVCDGNKVRDQNGKCINYEDCERCPEDSIYTDCINETTCENPHQKPGWEERCRKGCTCEEGLIRDNEINECVPIEECPQTEPGECKQGEVYKKCGPACVETCSDPNPVCNKDCKKGCFCPEGQIRDDCNRYKCINKKDCTSY